MPSINKQGEHGAIQGPGYWWESSLYLAGFLILSAPTLLWYVQRMSDGSDEPYGILALIAWAGFFPIRSLRAGSRIGPFPDRLEWIATIATAVALWVAPSYPLIRAGILVGSVSILAIRRGAPPSILGLGILSLPVIATLEFYCGYPLRYACGWLGVQALNLVGLPVRIEGISMWIEGSEIVIDRPCSGLKYLWFGWFLSALIAALFRLSLQRSIFFTVLSGLILFLANALRINLLFLLEWRDSGGPVTHEWVGLSVFALALLTILFVAGKLRRKEGEKEIRPAKLWATRNHARFIRPAGIIWCLLALTFTVFDLPADSGRTQGEQLASDARFSGPIATSSEGFAQLLSDVGDHIRLFEVDGSVILLREIDRPSRSVHPAEDCFRGSGYSIEHATLWKDRYERNWRRFYASRGDHRWEVRQRIEGADGWNGSDVSQWFWQAATGKTVGPWRMWVMIEEA